MDANPIFDGLLTRKQLAGLLNVCDKTITRHEARGMPFIKAGGMRLYNPASVRTWLLSRETTKRAA